jgi:hypothetical protein
MQDNRRASPRPSPPCRSKVVETAGNGPVRRPPRRVGAFPDRGGDRQLEERRGPLSEIFERARTLWDAIADSERTGARTHPIEQELLKSAYAVRLLTMLRGQLTAVDHSEAVTLVGPASTVSGVIAAAARNAVDDLGELIRESPKTGEEAQARLRMAVAAVAAWVETYVDCEALEWFTFDRRTTRPIRRCSGWAAGAQAAGAARTPNGRATVVLQAPGTVVALAGRDVP